MSVALELRRTVPAQRWGHHVCVSRIVTKDARIFNLHHSSAAHHADRFTHRTTW